jgi:hypothetical protein
MKNQITLLCLVLVLSACKTTSGPAGQPTKRHREFPGNNFAEFAQPTNLRDTLYLIDGDAMSSLTAKIWELDTIKVKPKIVMVTKEQMICIKTRCNKKK